MDGSSKREVIVVGASAGGFEAVSKLLSLISTDIEAALLVVIHLSSEVSGEGFLNYVKKQTFLECKLAEGGEIIEYGKVYIAPPDKHLLLKDNELKVIRGPRENKYRPSIDQLFRSAASSFGSQVIGVILTGMMEDGTAGMGIIKECGGITVVQDPEEASFPDMPLSVVGNIQVDYILPVEKIAELLNELIEQPIKELKPIPERIKKEAEIAERTLIGTKYPDEFGDLTPFVCPDCGGVLWKTQNNGQITFKCHVGHSFGEKTLIASKTSQLEESLWVALRMLEERRNLHNMMAEKDKSAGGRNWEQYKSRADEALIHINRIRDVLLNSAILGDVNGNTNLEEWGNERKSE